MSAGADDNAAAVAPVPQREPKIVRLPIQRQYEQLIQNGRKDVEGRPNIGIPKDIHAGDTIRFTGGTERHVVHVLRYQSFWDMVQDVGIARCLPGMAATIEEAVAIYHSFRNYEAMASFYGVRAFVLADP